MSVCDGGDSCVSWGAWLLGDGAHQDVEVKSEAVRSQVAGEQCHPEPLHFLPEGDRGPQGQGLW